MIFVPYLNSLVFGLGAAHAVEARARHVATIEIFMISTVVGVREVSGREMTVQGQEEKNKREER